MSLLLTSVVRGVVPTAIRTQLNIHDGAFFAKVVNEGEKTKFSTGF